MSRSFAASHPGATHADSLGMPVAFTDLDGQPFPHHPSACCGSKVSGALDEPTSLSFLYCTGCFTGVDEIYGGMPQGPFAKLATNQD